MQTFLPDPSYAMSARMLDTKRLGKQRVENLQIMQALLSGPTITKTNAHWYKNGEERIGNYTPWYNHPAVAMWRKTPASLYHYHVACVMAWQERGFSDTTAETMSNLVEEVDLAGTWPVDRYNNMPAFIGDNEFHSSHRAILLAKNYEEYKGRGWTETPAIKVGVSYPYFWPTKQDKYKDYYGT